MEGFEPLGEIYGAFLDEHAQRRSHSKVVGLLEGADEEGSDLM
jgi:hypothetical protein